ncbi:MAG: hypothetical protein M1827_003092 [Pycnora praestabilis]|nr:MAG: hypothetical protein M1827_003092 [Pycnora praestabilis]
MSAFTPAATPEGPDTRAHAAFTLCLHDIKAAVEKYNTTLNPAGRETAHQDEIRMLKGHVRNLEYEIEWLEEELRLTKEKAKKAEDSVQMYERCKSLGGMGGLEAKLEERNAMVNGLLDELHGPCLSQRRSIYLG